MPLSHTGIHNGIVGGPVALCQYRGGALQHQRNLVGHAYTFRSHGRSVEDH